MNIIFMGTPDFAVPSLMKLLKSDNHKVNAVFTACSKPSGRGLKELPSPIFKLASEYDIPTYTPSTLKTEEISELINSIEADIIIVVAYGFLIPKNILSSKKYGSINTHPSNLPKYRGAAPMQRTIMSGDTESAVCIIQMDEGLDTGDIILKEQFALDSKITLSTLHDRCSEIGANLVIEALDKIKFLPRIKQSISGVSYAHKLTKNEAKINWYETAKVIDCKIRGMTPWPGMYFEYQNKVIKILEADYKEQEHNLIPGTIIKETLEIACGKGVIIIKTLQQAGRSKLSSKEFLRGTPMPVGAAL